jgi:hypothetical protein
MRKIAEAGNAASKTEVGEACAKILGSTIVAATLEPTGIQVNTTGKVVTANGHPVFISPQAGLVVIGNIHNGKNTEENPEAKNTLDELLKPESMQSETENVPQLSAQGDRLAVIPSVKKDSSSLSSGDERVIEKSREQGTVILLPPQETEEALKESKEFTTKSLSQIQEQLLAQKDNHPNKNSEIPPQIIQQSSVDTSAINPLPNVDESDLKKQAGRIVLFEEAERVAHIMATGSTVEAYAASLHMEDTLRPKCKEEGINFPTFEKEYVLNVGKLTHTTVDQTHRIRFESDKDIPENDRQSVIKKLIYEVEHLDRSPEKKLVLIDLIHTQLEFLSSEEKAEGEALGKEMSLNFLEGFEAAVAKVVKRLENEMKTKEQSTIETQHVPQNIKILSKRHQSLLAGTKTGVEGEIFFRRKSARNMKKDLMKFIEAMGIEERQAFYEYLQSLAIQEKTIHNLILDDYIKNVEGNQEKEFEQVLKDRGQA